jgi:diaminopimelate epimerase
VSPADPPADTRRPVAEGLRAAKGHGTENDFVLFSDPPGRLDFSAPIAAALCDRRAGIGGDGAIRAVLTSVIASQGEPTVVEQVGQAQWFMDYRNSDGSLSQMCGNGLRVFVRYLMRLGLIDLEDGDTVAIGTRAGVKRVRREGDLLAADLGPWFLPGGPEAARAGHDLSVAIAGEPVVLPGLSVDVGNPHVVVALPDLDLLRRADLTRAPLVEPVPVEGINVELVVPSFADDAGHLVMRVHERGSGETRSCGTGAVASVLAARAWAGEGAPDTWWVEVPGGTLRVRTPAGATVAGVSVELAGPAVIVADVDLDPAWLDHLTEEIREAGVSTRI